MESEAQVSHVKCESTNLSKRQLKRLKKKERWEEIKHAKRAKEKEKKKQRRQEAMARGEDLGPSRKQLKHNRMTDSSCKLRVALDCSFDHLMGDKEISRLIKQLGHSYAANRRAENPLQFYVTSVTDKTKAKLEAFGDYRAWDVNFEEEHYLSVFNKEDVVYLTSESSNVIHHLDDDKIYIIGGLVDYNHHKGICYNLAVKNGISHGQLPIGDYIKLKTRKVLTVDQVFEILLRFTESKHWETAFLQVIPLRKGAVPLCDQDNKRDISADDSSLPSCVHVERTASTTENSSMDSKDNLVTEKVTESNYTTIFEKSTDISQCSSKDEDCTSFKSGEQEINSANDKSRDKDDSS